MKGISMKALWVILVGILAAPGVSAEATAPSDKDTEVIHRRLGPFFHPPAEYAKDFGSYSSPLRFYDGTPVKSPADWPRRREEILAKWHGLMGPWPKVIDRPKIDYLKKE